MHHTDDQQSQRDTPKAGVSHARSILLGDLERDAPWPFSTELQALDVWCLDY